MSQGCCQELLGQFSSMITTRNVSIGCGTAKTAFTTDSEVDRTVEAKDRRRSPGSDEVLKGGGFAGKNPQTRFAKAGEAGIRWDGESLRVRRGDHIGMKESRDFERNLLFYSNRPSRDTFHLGRFRSRFGKRLVIAHTDGDPFAPCLDNLQEPGSDEDIASVSATWPSSV